jgi:hypothetical protein
MPSSITYIGESAFGNNSLTSVIIPDKVTTIGGYAFSNNELTNVSFEENSYIQEIAAAAFLNNDNLTSVTLPSNINEKFSKYMDGHDLIYQANDDIYYFDIAYYAVDELGNRIN